MSLEKHRHLNADGFARQQRVAVLDERIAALAGHLHAATYRLIAMLRVFDELHGWAGWPSPAHWLQWRCGFSLGAAREKVRVARAVTRIATPANEATVLMWAQHSTASHMEKLARLYRRHG